MVKELVNGSVGGFNKADQYGYYSHPFNVVFQNGNQFFFTANNYPSAPGSGYTNDIELYFSDGTAGGTYMLKDIYPGAANGSYPADFTVINGTLYFTANTPTSGRELWKSDGTPNGTVLVKELVNGPVGGFNTADQYGYYSHPFNVVYQNGNQFFFTANNYPSAPGSGYTNDIELFFSDGTAGGTYMLKDIYPGAANGSYPSSFTVINGTLYFTANNPTSGRELWKSDGTPNGTVMVKELVNGPVGGFNTADQYGYYSHPFNVVFQNGNQFFFTANNYPSAPGSGYTNDIELFFSDGTAGGTYMLKDIYPGAANGSYPSSFTVINGILYFTANNATSGRELWKTDGTPNGTVMVKELVNGPVGGFNTADQYGYYSHPFNVVYQNGNQFFFTANNYPSAPGSGYTNDIEMFFSDGTAAGTYMLKDIYPGAANGSYPSDFKTINGLLYFTANNNTSGRELWKTDGTPNGTVMVKEIHAGNVGGFNVADQYGYTNISFNSPFSAGGYFYFAANDNASAPGGSYTNNVELWKSDGTNAGTNKVIEIHPATNQGCYASYFNLALGKVFFTATDPVNGNELWVLDNAVPTALNTPEVQTAFNVYPNPATEKVNLMMQVSDKRKEDVVILLTDLSGRVLYKNQTSVIDGSLSSQIDVSGLKAGMYILNVTGSKIHEVSKVVKE
jgi:ELWxxDGT repeat protein